MNLSVSLSMGVSKLPASSAAPHSSLPPQGAVTANPKSPSPCPLSTSTDRAALSHLSKGSGGAQITQQHPTDPRFVSEHLFGDTVALLCAPHTPQHQPHNYGSTQHLLTTTSCQNPCKSFSVTNPIQPLPAGHRAVLSSPLCSSSLVLCQSRRW